LTSSFEESTRLSTSQPPQPLDPPPWFTRAISQPAESRWVQVDGVPIHYLYWNPQDEHKPGLLFAHGFRAHARWWSCIAPFFLSRFRVCALDFAGMGDSGHRPHYEPELFTRDLVGVIEDARLGPATLIGHSFGGGRVLRACAEFPELVQRAVLIDSMVNVPGQPARHPPPLDLRAKKVYPTLEEALERFRLVPAPNATAPYILDYIARHSLQQHAQGWSWKFDANFAPRHNEPDGSLYLQRIEMPLSFIYGEFSLVVSRERAHAIVRHMRNGHGPIAIPQAHHHVLLDQPLALVAALRATLY
jgi:pimeloyl-ACP methyl ester carboxylesterase